ncbi:MAG TPA: serine hydrolase [Prolixibacteraceae bacterium]|nr:serine hydrolase [Prolixibacteraceae bacterium]
MEKQITIFLILIFSIIFMDQAGNISFAQARLNDASSFTEKVTINPNTSVHHSPDDVGMNSVTLARIESIVKEGIKARALPGCQVLVLKDGKSIYDKCFGYYTYETTQAVKPTTLYDLASLSKTTGTLLAIMKLYDNGQLKLTDKASRYLTFLRGTDKENITIKELLLHETGLPGDLSCYRLVTTKEVAHAVHMGCTNIQYKEDWVSTIPRAEYTLQVSDSFYLYEHFHQAAMQMIANIHIRSKSYLYSSVNFILLKEIAEFVSGIPMDVFLNKEFFTPMKLKYMTYLPLRTHQKKDIAPTFIKDFLRNGVLQGYVQDPDAAFLGGVAGNAGLFATASDVATVYQMLLNRGEMDGKRYLKEETCRIFTTTTSKSARRYLGFDKPVPANPKHSPCCVSAPKEVFGHTGYTGTCCWVDPVNRFVFVFLSNRTYPNDAVNKLAKMNIRTRIQEVIYQSMKK